MRRGDLSGLCVSDTNTTWLGAAKKRPDAREEEHNESGDEDVKVHNLEVSLLKANCPKFGGTISRPTNKST